MLERHLDICAPLYIFHNRLKGKMNPREPGPLKCTSDKKTTKPKQIPTCGEGSCWGTCPFSRVVSSVSPKILLRCWAMTACCSTPQWFSRDKMTGKSDTYQTGKKRHWKYWLLKLIHEILSAPANLVVKVFSFYYVHISTSLQNSFLYLPKVE